MKDVLDINKDKPCVITLHGPSLNLHKEAVSKKQESGDAIRISVNNWFDYFTTPPDYWVLSSSEHGFPIRNLFHIIREHNMPIFYSDDGDFTPKEMIHKELNSEWMVYDQRHWKGEDCMQILKSFKAHCKENKNFSFKKYGNNEIMWHPPRCYTMSGHSLDGKCCQQNNPPRTTLQEYLMNLSGHDAHYSTGDTVAMHAIAFAIIMGCNPIYVSGLDLDYNKGYANPDMSDWKSKAQSPNAWTPVRDNLENDLRILNASAEKRGIKVYTLNQSPWYDAFEIATDIK